MKSTEQQRAEFEDGAWYWVEKEGWHDEPPKIAPAMYRADCNAWYSWEFSGTSTEYLKVLEPCVRHEQAARRAPVVPKGWLPTTENINELPEPLRKYICDLETNADPSGMVRHNTILRDQVAGLQVMYRKAADALAAAPQPPEAALDMVPSPMRVPAIGDTAKMVAAAPKPPEE